MVLQMKKSFKYRLFVNKTQEAKLGEFLNSARFLYNCALSVEQLCQRIWVSEPTVAQTVGYRSTETIMLLLIF